MSDELVRWLIGLLISGIVGEFWIIIRLGRQLGREKDRRAAEVKKEKTERAAEVKRLQEEKEKIQEDRIKDLEELRDRLRSKLDGD